MATRSRLGRDPLEKAAPSPTRATGRKAPKKAPARQGPAPDAPTQKTPPPGKRAAALPDPAAQVQDMAATDPRGAPLPEAPEPAAVAGQAPVPDEAVETVDACPEAMSPERAGTPPAAPASAACLPPSPPQAEPADSPAATLPAATADPDAPAGQTPLCQGEQALTLFLRGVLDAFLPDDPHALRVVIDAGSAAVPLDKILFFSQVLHRIVFPTARPDQFVRRPGEDCGPLPVLTVRLSPGAADRHVLELYDNGRYFRDRWPQPSLGLEALHPLTTYVVAHGGSIQLAKGRCVAFAITN